MEERGTKAGGKTRILGNAQKKILSKERLNKKERRHCGVAYKAVGQEETEGGKGCGSRTAGTGLR